MAIKIAGVHLGNIGGGPASITLEDLADVSVVSPQTGQYLRYNAGITEWQNSYIDSDVYTYLSGGHSPTYAGMIGTNGVSITYLSGNSSINLALSLSATGDATGTVSGGVLPLTLSTTGVVPGIYGSTSQIPQFDVDAAGRITSITTVPASGTSTANLSGGTTGALPYQSAPSTTAFVPAGTSSQVLIGGASAPAWSSAPSILGTNFSSIPNSALTNSTITVGSTSIALGATSTTLAGLTSVTSTTFVGALTGTSTNSNNSAVTNDNATGTTVYPTWVTTTTGFNPVSVSSSKLTFIPSTGVLTASAFSGDGSALSNISNASLASGGTLTIGSTSIALGATSTTLAGLTSVTSATFVGALTGSATSAASLTTPRNISATGDASWTVSFNGSGDVSGVLTLSTVNASVGNYASVSVNNKGLVISAANLSGDITTSGSVSTLATVNSTPVSNSFQKITTNGKGLVTATSDVMESDITTALTYTPVNQAGDTMTGYLLLNGDPVSLLGAATKQYVDAVASSLTVHPAVRTLANAQINADIYNSIYADGTAGFGGSSASGLGVGATLTDSTAGTVLVVDGVTLALDDRVLVGKFSPYYALSNSPTVKTVPVNTGTGYVTSDVVTIVGGTFTTAAQFTVTASGGNVTSVALLTAGSYTVLPTLNVPLSTTTSGAGTNLTLEVAWNAAFDGIYYVSQLGVTGTTPWILTRSVDSDNHQSGQVRPGNFVFVSEGTTYENTGWVETAFGTGSPSGTLRLGFDSLAATQFSGAGTYTAGTGLQLTGSVFSNTGVLSNVAGTGIGVSSATGNVTISNDGVLSTIAGTNISVSSGTGNVTISVTGTVPTATTSTNIAGGAAGSVPYQTATDTTSMLAAGTSNQVLISGTTPSWTNMPTLTGTNFTGIPNAGLTNSSITIGSTSIALGATSTTLAGLTSVTSATFVGALTGNATTATTATNAVNSAITDNTSTATSVYPAWVSATSGNNPINTSGSKLSFVPSTGVLTATQFSGSGAGLTNIPNSAFTNNSITIGSTNIALGATSTTLAGLTSVSTSLLTVGSGSTGLLINSTFGGIYNTGVGTPTASNFSFSATPTNTYLNASTSIGLNISNSAIVTVISSGISVTGSASATSFSGAGTGLTGTAAGLSIGGNAATSTSTSNITGGSASQLVYQTGASTTSFLSTANYGVLISNLAGLPSWLPGAAGVLQGSASSNPVFTTTPTLTGTNFTGIPNGALTNNSITVTAGSGLSGGGSVALGSSTTLSLGTTGSPISNLLVKITTDTFGRVSSSSSVTASDITTILTYTPVNKAGDTMSGALNYATIVSLASASTVNIGAASSNEITITGSTTITAFDTIASGASRTLTFTGTPLLTYNATSLILPTAGSIAVQAGDTAEFVSLGSGNWKCVWYQRATGSPLAGTGASVNITDDTSSNATYYPGMSAATSGIWSTAYTSSTKLSFNPSTGILTATQFSGSGAGLTSIPNAALTNSSVTIGSTSIALGATSTTLAGLTSVTSTTFVGALTGNASTATNIAGGAANQVAYQSGANTTSFVTNAAGVLEAATSGAVPTWTTTPTLTGTNFTGIPNGALTNNSITVTAGSGLSGGGSVALGGSTTLTLGTTGVTAGTYNNTANAVTPFTIDATGRITSIGANVPINAPTSWSALTAPTTSNSVTATVDTSQTLLGHFDTSAANAQSLFTFSEDTASTKIGTLPNRSRILSVTALSGSTAHPFVVTATGFTGLVGTFSVLTGGSVNASGSSYNFSTANGTGAVASGTGLLQTGNGFGAGSGALAITTGSDSSSGNTGNISIFTGTSTGGTTGGITIGAGPTTYLTVSTTGLSVGSTIDYAADVSIASASTVNIGAALSNNVSITGTTTITAFDTRAAGAVRRVNFQGILTLTYNATSLILPTAANIITGAGDNAQFTSLGAGNWRCDYYQRASGQALVGTPDATKLPLAGGTLTGSLTTVAVSMGRSLLTQPQFVDESIKFTDLGTINNGTAAFNRGTGGSWQRVAPTGTTCTITITGWPTSGQFGDLGFELVNGGAAGLVITWPTINWIKSDGSFTTTFSANGVTLQASGTDFVTLWTRDNGTTIYGKIIR